MATGGSEEDICSVCLDLYRDPKFLPCYHTFCATCIQDVADRHPKRSFPCPSCRKLTSLPSGGVSALQSNFYIKKDDKPKPKTPAKKLCKVHDDKKLEFYCVICDEAICLNCKLTRHELHKTEDLHEAVDRKKKELTEHQDRLQRAVASTLERVIETERERKALLEKKAAVERNIRERHATIVAAANKFRDEALNSLRSVTEEIESNIAGILNQQEKNLEELLEIQRELESTMNDGEANDVITITRKLRSGRGSEGTVRKMTSLKINDICRPVLRFNVTADVMVQKVRDFMGTVSKVEMEVAAPEVTVVERFRCGEDTDIEVFTLCHVDQDSPCVFVSYDRCGLTENTPVKPFEEKGKLITAKERLGRVTHKRYAKGLVMYPIPKENNMSSFCKSRIDTHYRLNNYLSGNADINIVTVTSEEPVTVKSETEFTIKVGAHRAFDVDDEEQFFVVVEEAKLPDTWRKVLLYQRASEDPVATYTPPTLAFQPSDVCFYTLGHQHVLLVSDELCDAIHVVHVQDRVMTFLRYLAPGCPSLIQPTAMTVDVSGRLWVACRGGHIITMEPKT